MSYILDALRRLDQDKENTRKGVNPMEAVLSPPRAEEVSRPVNRFRLAAVGAGVLVVVVILTYWVTRHSLQPGSTPPGKKTAVSLPDGSGDAGTLAGARPGTLAASPTPLPPGTAPPAREVYPVRPAAPPAVPAAPIERGRVAATAPPPRSMSPYPAVAQPGLGRPVETRSRPDLKISAIVWSPEKEERFAVVNLKTVHEGDLFEGLLVEEIQEDGIVFEVVGRGERFRVGRP